MMTNLKAKNVIAAAVFLGLAFLIFPFYDLGSYSAKGQASIKEFTVSAGEPFNSIADNLKENGLIKSKTIFKAYSFLTGRMENLKAGKYFLGADFSLTEIARILSNGPEESAVMIFPGMTLKEIDAKLAENSIIKAGSLAYFNPRLVSSDYPWLKGADSLEGFLLPDTYRFTENSGAESVARKFLDNFNEKAFPFLKNSGDEFLNTLILASILEKEIPNFEEQKIAAGIFKKRMEVGMALQADATVIYAKCSGRFIGCAPLTRLDFEIDSPYNSYFYAGLPPYPISNPSPKTIEAASQAEKSDFWYYLSDPKTKRTIFGKTLEEHNDNRVLYLQKK